jgi:serine/threonine-protein kinase
VGSGEKEELPPTLPADARLGSSRPPPVGPSAPISALVLGDVIAEGGMGVVRAAVQRSLGRPVVIKTAPAHATSDDARRMLLEAWVTGYLEHPGVVPVYDIVKGQDDAPVVVMRRIRGRTWHSCMHDEEWARAQGARDLLEQNLRVLVRVCEIVEFAHDKHVVHRDLKPANVMVGAFGEVYLLDWGLAVATGGDPANHLPLAADARDPCGTLSYAAPEMLALIEAPISPRTDVYLLGSVLFEIVTGKPPHRASETRDTVQSIDATPPPMPDGLSPQISAVCNRALQKTPEDRYATVADLRRDVLAFLRQRDSERIVEAASSSLARLEEACKEGNRQRIYDLYGECRFAFQEALRMAPELASARHGLVAATRAVVENELPRDPHAAAALLAAVKEAIPELDERVREALAKDEAERAAQARVARDHDSRIGGRGRMVFLSVFGVAWAAGQFADKWAPISYRRFIIGSLIQLPLVGLFWLVSKQMRATLFNRRMMGAVAVHVASQAGLFACGAMLGADIHLVRLLQVGQWGVITTLLAVVFEKRFWPMAAGMVGAAITVFLVPASRPIASSIAIAILCINVALTRAPKA